MIQKIQPLDFPWETPNPFLFCAYHADHYPAGNCEMGPDTKLLSGRHIGMDFTLKDGWRMYHGEKVPGFPVHPHRGFETITVVEKGLVDHADSMGAAGRYGKGDVQWMTAGKGIQHSEMFPMLNTDRDNPCELFQIWLNLPKASKFVEPHFAMHWSENIPVVTTKDDKGKRTEVKLVAGGYKGQKANPPAPGSWASNPENKVMVWVIKMEAGAEWTLPPTEQSVNRTLFFFEGDKITSEGREIKDGHSIELGYQKPLPITNGDSASRFLFLQGKPIDEPVVKYGPFVMNTNLEIQQAMLDYRQTQFGGWPWPRPDMVHGTVSGRFAKHADGKEETP